MRRTLLGLYTYFEFFSIAVLMLPVFAAVAVWKRDSDPTYRARGRVMRFFGHFTSRLTPIWKFSVEGEAPADIDERGYVVVANHESVADPFLLTYLPFDMRFIAKEEMFRLPLIGWLLQCSGDIRLKRGHGDSIRAMMEECRRTLEHGLSVMIFPEGTRTRDGQLLPFKDGAFRLAIETQSPVLPVALKGTRTCMPADSLWFGEARAAVRILEPVPTAGLTLADVEQLKATVRERIAVATAKVEAQLAAAEHVEPEPYRKAS